MQEHALSIAYRPYPRFIHLVCVQVLSFVGADVSKYKFPTGGLQASMKVRILS